MTDGVQTLFAGVLVAGLTAAAARLAGERNGKCHGWFPFEGRRGR